jgi:glucokinase
VYCPSPSTDNAEFIDQLVSIVARPEFADCDRVGIGSPGPLDLDSGNHHCVGKYARCQRSEARRRIKVATPGKEFRLENDANAATLGEKYFGAGKALGDFAVLTLGTGVGGGCIWRQIAEGFSGNFFEVGHVNVAGIFAEGARRCCGCGSTGCLEAYASATGIAKSFEINSG